MINNEYTLEVHSVDSTLRETSSIQSESIRNIASDIQTRFGISIPPYGLPPRIVSLIRRTILVNLFLIIGAILLYQVSIPLGTSMLLITAASLQMFAYAIWVETKQRIINPTLLPFTIVLTFFLALLVLGSLVIT